MKLLLNPEFNLYEKDNLAFCDSLQIAETFEKRHDSVLRDIRNTMQDATKDFNLHNFVEIKYKDGKGRSYPKYLLTKDGFTLLVMGYTGKKATQFKIAYINRFNQMEKFIKSLLSTKLEFPEFTEAITLSHDEPKHYHFSNEINMIYKIVLGVDAKTYRKNNGLDDGAVIKPHLTLAQIKAIETLQRVDIGLHEAGFDYEKRKEALKNKFNKMQLRLAS